MIPDGSESVPSEIARVLKAGDQLIEQRRHGLHIGSRGIGNGSYGSGRRDRRVGARRTLRPFRPFRTRGALRPGCAARDREVQNHVFSSAFLRNACRRFGIGRCDGADGDGGSNSRGTGFARGARFTRGTRLARGAGCARGTRFARGTRLARGACALRENFIDPLPAGFRPQRIYNRYGSHVPRSRIFRRP